MKRFDVGALVVLVSLGTLVVFFAGYVTGRRDGVTLIQKRCAP